uniref:Leukotriene C4 synthase n=1 Tax=Pelusios castaneus TaxID=367368 RepID=A0A8C8SLS8_9SAUR
MCCRKDERIGNLFICLPFKNHFLLLTTRKKEDATDSVSTYFSLQVIYARRAYGISPPKVSGPPDFERVFRAQVNCSEYFPIFLAVVWQAGLFCHQGLSAALGLLYLFSRYCYFVRYKQSSMGR